MLAGMTIYASDGTTIETAHAPAPADVDTDGPTPTPEPELAASDPAASETLPAVCADAPLDAELIDAAEPADDGKWQHQSPWEYDWIDYQGDRLAIRVPHQHALTALFQAGQQCSHEFQADLTTKFVKRHIPQESIQRVLERMSDPDDEAYSSVTVGVWGDLLRIIAEIGGKRAVKDAEALAAVQAGKPKA